MCGKKLASPLAACSNAHNPGMLLQICCAVARMLGLRTEARSSYMYHRISTLRLGMTCTEIDKAGPSTHQRAPFAAHNESRGTCSVLPNTPQCTHLHRPMRSARRWLLHIAGCCTSLASFKAMIACNSKLRGSSAYLYDGAAASARGCAMDQPG
jgi:hypothetical protein